MKLIVERLSPAAKLPTRAYEFDAGLDLYADEAVAIEPGNRAIIKTGIRLAIPDGCVGLIWDKGGLAKDGLHTIGGVIDAGFRGEILIGLLNIDDKAHKIETGQKIAQILIQPIEFPEIIEAKVETDTQRAEGLHGSSGRF